MGKKTGMRDAFGNCNSTCQCNYEPFRYVCVKGSCGAECSASCDCQNKCIGDVRYYRGSCTSGCTCSYSTEDCNKNDKWIKTSEKRWIPCEDDKCKQCEQVKEEFRDYYCVPSGCNYTVTQETWESTGRRKSIICPTGTYCQDGNCVPPPKCGGQVEINTDVQACPGKYLTIKAGGLSYCDKKKVYFKLDSCDGKALASCTLKNGKCEAKVKFKDLGTPVVVACIDINGDGNFTGIGETDLTVYNVNCNNCAFNQCSTSAGCSRCYKCGGYCTSYVNSYFANVCLNPGQSCDYSCVPGYCGKTTC